ncbi:hypothetical protein [Thalassococcus sp. S3]|uniref:DUF6985 domain-containing protein n=1 Tax=Thalassococcus sp. S3 TaxID=2017482 RepID=UPI0010244128|nr:hypothetical protein [Thalassococcus sp. S3]QBF29835.1 hypothetical protein CFI11_01200 [Thalassococcus sp. S3]
MELTIKPRYFDDHEFALEREPATPEEESSLNAFLALDHRHRLADTIHVYSYYKDFQSAVDGEDGLDAEMGIPDSPEAIWDHVRPRHLYFKTRPEYPDTIFIAIMAACDWESEHGLWLVWEKGERLIKAGPYDSHVTNRTAYADEKMAGVVYASSDQRFITRLTDTASVP